jgi:hypothetical protein
MLFMFIVQEMQGQEGKPGELPYLLFGMPGLWMTWGTRLTLAYLNRFVAIG